VEQPGWGGVQDGLRLSIAAGSREAPGLGFDAWRQKPAIGRSVGCSRMSWSAATTWRGRRPSTTRCSRPSAASLARRTRGAAWSTSTTAGASWSPRRSTAKRHDRFRGGEPRRGRRLARGGHGERRHRDRGPARGAPGRRRRALPRLPARPGRQQALRAPPDGLNVGGAWRARWRDRKSARTKAGQGCGSGQHAGSGSIHRRAVPDRRLICSP
jgi:hypothetical protein